MTHKNIFTGSFDPPTFGHQSIVRRASRLLGEVTIVVCSNLDKKHMFGRRERTDMVVSMVKDIPNVIVDYLESGKMLSSFIKEHDSEVLIRGVRNGLDLEYERSIEEFVKQYGINEVVYLLNEPELATISSSVVRNHLHAMKENNNFNQSLYRYLPEEVIESLTQTEFVKGFENLEELTRIIKRTIRG